MPTHVSGDLATARRVPDQDDITQVESIEKRGVPSNGAPRRAFPTARGSDKLTGCMYQARHSRPCCRASVYVASRSSGTARVPSSASGSTGSAPPTVRGAVYTSISLAPPRRAGR